MSPVAAAPSPPAGPSADTSYPRLVADIGGTNARFGWVAHAGAGVDHVQQLPVREHAGPVQAAQTYLAQLKAQAQTTAPWQPPRRAALAVATAVQGDRVEFTNSHWRFSRQAVQQELGLDSLLLLNDFESLALSLPCLGAAQRRCHDERAPQASGTLAVVGPGTGLGVGAVVATRCGWVALPGEGGHATLAPADDLESELLDQLRREHAHVSAERLLSGIGLPVLYQALGEVLGQPVAQALATRDIVDRGVACTDPLASQTLDLFCALLGGFAGNVALTLGARSGLYIAGGIVPRFADRFFASAFRERFEAKGRFREYLAAVPSALITDTLAALSGSALAIEQQVVAERA